MLLKLNPNHKKRNVHFSVPSSKPETQRAILMGSLAKGTSLVYNDLRCSETERMKTACRLIGATIIEHPTHLEIIGIDGKITAPHRVIDSHGSGLVFRIFTALSCFADSPTIITGDAILCRRVMKPLFDALRQLGAELENICDPDTAPVVNRAQPLVGGECVLPGDISSQFITAILIAAPFAKKETRIKVVGDIYSLAYIQQTVYFMQKSGIELSYDAQTQIFIVQPGRYHSFTTKIKEDYTSATYLLTAAALTPGQSILSNMYAESLQGESAILEILKTLGIDCRFDSEKHQLVINNPHEKLKGDYHFDSKNFPNIVPTLAVLGAFVHGSLRVTGASLTRFHKASRVEAIVNELRKINVDIEIIYHNGHPDGFIVKGRSSYQGNVVFSSWKDHRIFMSLFIMGLHTELPCYYSEYEDTHCSFPNFINEFAKSMASVEIVNKAELVVTSSLQDLQAF